MRKALFLSVGILILSFCLLVIGSPATATQKYVDVYVNEVQVAFPDLKPFVDTKVNTTYVPLRFVSEALEAEVEWDGGKRLVLITQQDQEISMRIGSRNATINGRTQFVGVSAKLMDGRTVVPLRFVSEVLGAEVNWTPPAGNAKGKVSIMPGSGEPEPAKKPDCPGDGSGGCVGCPRAGGETCPRDGSGGGGGCGGGCGGCR